MKKITIILFVLLFICGMTIVSFAQTTQAAGAKKSEVKAETIKGKIISVDVAKNTIVLKEGKAGAEKTLTVDPKVIASLRANEDVKISVKEGSNTAASVKEVFKKTKSTKK